MDKLSLLDVPCVIITAKNDMVAMKANLDSIIDNAPKGFYTYEFPEGGHMMMEYNPKATLEQTLPTIAKCK